MSSRSSFPEDHPLFAGFLRPEQQAITAALGGYDLVVVLGAPAFTYHVYHGPSETPVPSHYVVSDDPDVLARAPEGRGIRSTLRLAISQLTERLQPATRLAPAALQRPPAPEPTRPINVAYVYATISELTDPDTIVVEEAPTSRTFMHDHLPIRSRAGGGFYTTASGALGFGMPAAVGVALARPDRPVVAVIGDGSSMYGIQALWTAAKEQAKVTFVILDNSEYAAVRRLGDAQNAGKLPGIELGAIDFSAVAGGLGCAAHRVDDPDALKPTLVQAMAEPGPSVVHVVIAAGPPAP